MNKNIDVVDEEYYEDYLQQAIVMSEGEPMRTSFSTGKFKETLYPAATPISMRGPWNPPHPTDMKM